ncbi:MAG: hypothetical protein PWP20_751 [Eubacteriaceae bacterium]|nr:hypothetical protein [Eubacteriaceae bacterium]
MNIKLSDNFSYGRLLRFVLPTVVMMIVSSVYSIVDGFFISNFAGKNAFAAVNLVMPVLMIIGSFGFMIGTGGSALVAKTLGEGNQEKANRIFSMLITVVLIVGLSLSILGFVFIRPLAMMIGASDLIIDDCVLYGRILIASCSLFMLQNCFQSFLVTAERPHMGLVISIIAGLNNVFFDFLFVYVFSMGIAGAAIATAMSQLIGALVPVIYFLGPNKSLLRLVKPEIDLKALRLSCINGSSEMMTGLSTSLVSMLYNYQLVKIAAENGIAAYGAIMYLSMLFMSLYFGFSIGVGPIIAYHYGADNNKELKSLFRKSLVIVMAAGVSMVILAETLAAPLSGLFVGYNQELLDLTLNGMRLFSLSFVLSGFNIFGSAFFTALNNGPVSALISFMRTLVMEVGAVLILPIFLGINGIWLAIVVAEGVTAVLTGTLLLKNNWKYQYLGFKSVSKTGSMY